MSVGSHNKAVFLDRDGIVNVSPGAGYVERWDDFKLMPGFVEVMRMVISKGYQPVVITNQSCIAKGIVSRDVVEEIHRNLISKLKDEFDLELLDVVYCPHNDDECDCRKPLPGMITQSAEKHAIDLKSSWMIGDSERDITAGRDAGCRTIRVCAADLESEADVKVSNMAELLEVVNAEL